MGPGLAADRDRGIHVLLGLRRRAAVVLVTQNRQTLMALSLTSTSLQPIEGLEELS